MVRSLAPWWVGLIFIVALSLTGCDDRNFAELSVEELIELLGDQEWTTREQASEELSGRGPETVPPMLEELGRTEDAEVEDRLEQILRTHGAFVVGNRLVAELTNLAGWKRNLEEQVDIVRGGAAGWEQQVRQDLDAKFQAIRAVWLNEQDPNVQQYLGTLLQDISVLADGVQPPAVGTSTGPITAQQAADGLESIADRLRDKIDLHGDMDGDGMPTSWELQHGLNATQNDANQDADNDGKPNAQEHRQGTDPQDPND